MIINKTTGKRIAENEKYCNNIFSMATGLMFRHKDSVKATGWIFLFDSMQKICITMLFVFFEIEIIFLDSKFRVSDIKSLKPFQNYCSPKQAKYVIELEKGVIKKSGIKIGHKIFIRNRKLYK
ncbi:TPA: hypothetical protein HA235_05835 [Candidatus Woesearchaeota archaeon]|nr:DUF192 domain-containing protein [Candidatus Woesearchaeota archaeon]HIH32203.1 hypothetical protein [Candidatus Woesearchaeota archaeon]HIH55590.1 hypothetical protein [Candidatus Woesearchaeota archaeon]HIJ02562.1 hypothetical protein [Candidatus Woesearchaeota archaeon]HIJ13392.1 hypothetical protein [Candidatus Woesearchaeota archaeon]